MKRTRLLIAVPVMALLLIGTASIARADSDDDLRTRLSGFNEVSPILSNGTAVFTAAVSSSSLTFTLTFSNLSSSATAAHIHFGQPGVNGTIVVFLCGGAKPACPAGGGTVTGTVTAADVLGVPAQGVTAGSFADLLRILRSGDAYVNIHTTNHPAGEIRGQIRSEE